MALKKNYSMFISHAAEDGIRLQKSFSTFSRALCKSGQMKGSSSLPARSERLTAMVTAGRC